ncbi:lytic transglycosylase domain-containing protein [Actinocatenispora rupis]|uniref:Transglycosylase SLT domain-containing protein n=1 Tax=Actinocatenispora rupis TaxID=519421 RepID=A0A8J3J8T6_9ACTN|nr:lytic transglycosylase domain-containing protein [Actinocatenispora rupis]GID10443.1 hypothetical protein Aru02nite_13320 [Actinocatenispora rupis]
MNRAATKMSVRLVAVFVLVVGLVAGAYLGINRPGAANTTEVAQQQVVGDPADPIEEQQQQHAATDGYRQQQMRDEASRSASRDARRKAAAGGEHAATVAQDADAAKQDEQKKSSSSGSGSTVNVGPIPTSCKEYSGNKATGCTLMLQAGYQIDQMACLSKLWDRESGWNVHAQNPSGAYGIPQALPGDKMAQYGSDWQDNAAVQIKWGLGYIKDRYSSPCGAWQHSESTGWY